MSAETDPLDQWDAAAARDHQERHPPTSSSTVMFKKKKKRKNRHFFKYSTFINAYFSPELNSAKLFFLIQNIFKKPIDTLNSTLKKVF